MKYAEIKYYDIANGPGVRTTLFVSGCRHRCPECFNQMAWDFAYGEEFDEAVQKKIIDSVNTPFVAGITLLGGEPMEVENQRGLLPFLKRFREECPGKTIWCFSGFTYEQLTGKTASRCRCECTDEMLALCDVLVDGPFVKELHDITLRFRGSSNQRLIDLKKTAEEGQIIWWADAPEYQR